MIHFSSVAPVAAVRPTGMDSQSLAARIDPAEIDRYEEMINIFRNNFFSDECVLIVMNTFPDQFPEVLLSLEAKNWLKQHLSEWFARRDERSIRVLYICWIMDSYTWFCCVTEDHNYDDVRVNFLRFLQLSEKLAADKDARRLEVAYNRFDSFHIYERRSAAAAERDDQQVQLLKGTIFLLRNKVTELCAFYRAFILRPADIERLEAIIQSQP